MNKHLEVYKLGHFLRFLGLVKLDLELATNLESQMDYTVAIVGGGPAGLSAFQFLSGIPGIRPILLEAGPDLETRLKQNTPESVINGAGGAGLFSDRKISTFPAGSGQLQSNPYEMRDSYMHVLAHLGSVLPHHKADFKRLLADTMDFLGTDDLSSEALDRKMEKLMPHMDSVKLYPSVVLSKMEDAESIIRSYIPDLEDESKGEIHFGCEVSDIVWNANTKNYRVSYDYNVDGEHRRILTYVDFVLLAMGRFGPETARWNYKIFENHNLMEPRRLEFGVRVLVDSHPPLRDALIKYGEKNPDPKLKIRRSFIIGGKSVECEFRTFCVCLPHENGSGYMVESRDLVTDILSVSGSSSFDELQEREQLAHVHAGSNLGIMMRICDPDVIRRHFSWSKGGQRYQPKTRWMHLQPDEKQQEALMDLGLIFPKDLCYPLLSGILEIIQTYSGQPVRGNLYMMAPCIEGVGMYPKVDPRTYEVIQAFEGVFVAGDMVGHTRGLLQALVTGHMAAKSIVTKMVERNLVARGILRGNHQSIFLPGMHYKKLVMDNQRESIPALMRIVKDATPILKNLRELFGDVPLNRDHYERIRKGLFRVKYTGSGDKIGVLYEFHHFFLDSENPGEHFISQLAATEYMMICNAVEERKLVLATRVIQEMVELDVEFKNTLESLGPDFMESIAGAFQAHDFKACILALRMRKDLASREDFSDVPVMQSAYKLTPIEPRWYKQVAGNKDPVQWDSLNLLQQMNVCALRHIEYRIVAVTCALLDAFFKKAIECFGFHLRMVRNKIETQEPAVDSAVPDTDPLYLECHVKISICEADGRGADFHDKKRIIQSLASLFEGPRAVVRDIFNVISVSINLLKHPDGEQQFFLTYRTDTKSQMEYVRRHFSKILAGALEMLPADHELRRYKFRCYTDAEFVIYDDNRPLDLIWFPITTGFLDAEYQRNIRTLVDSDKKIFVVTTNDDKFREIREGFRKRCGDKVYVSQYTCAEYDGNETDLLKYVVAKAKKIAVGIPFLVEATGLRIYSMGGFPGAQTKEVIKSIGIRGMLRLADRENVGADTAACYYDGREYYTALCGISGEIVPPSGSQGFGWDSIFAYEGRRLADMTPEEKAEIFPRSMALEAILDACF
jgi:XTP/dITP diphosphohydrolase